MKSFYFICFLAMMFFLCACKDTNEIPEKSNTTKPTSTTIPTATTQKDIFHTISQESWFSQIDIPYRIKVYMGCWDAPEYELVQSLIQAYHNDISPKNAVSVEFLDSSDIASKILQAKSLADLGPEFSSLKDTEIIYGLLVFENEKICQWRCFDLTTGRWSGITKLQKKDTRELLQEALKTIWKTMAWTGYIVQKYDSNWQVVLRIPGAKWMDLQQGSCFCLYQQNRRLADSFMILKDTKIAGNVVFATMEYKGTQNCQPGLRIQQISLAKTSQKFRLVNQEQKPQPGYSIFTSYDGFSTDSKDYQGTTAINGEFILTATEERPIFVSIAKTVEDITFAFFRKVIFLQGDTNIETIIVYDGDIATQEAKEITEDNIRAQKMQMAKRLVATRLEQAKEHLQNKELPNALVAIKSAQQYLKDLDESERIGLQHTLSEIESVYENAIRQKQAKEDLAKSYKMLEECDHLVAKIEYASAQEVLERVKEIWPREFYEKEFAEYTKRETKLLVLKQEASTALGQARQYVCKVAPKLTPEEIDSTILQKLHVHLKVLYAQGCMDKNQVYNDWELWLQTRSFLNELSQQLAQKGQEYLERYNKATSVQQRSDFLEKHQKSHQYSRVIDEWLQQMH